jgi:hypothetical protein
MKQLITALVLATAAITAQAAEINLDCEYTGVTGTQQQVRVIFDPALGGGSVGKLDVAVQTRGQNYVLVDTRFGTSHTINRETLDLTIQSFGNNLKGSCKVATQSKNKI